MHIIGGLVIIAVFALAFVYLTEEPSALQQVLNDAKRQEACPRILAEGERRRMKEVRNAERAERWRARFRCAGAGLSVLGEPIRPARVEPSFDRRGGARRLG